MLNAYCELGDPAKFQWVSHRAALLRGRLVRFLLRRSFVYSFVSSGFFGEPPLEQQLRRLTARFKTWASVHGLEHSQGYITPGVLHAEGYPSLTLKAHNGRLMVVFLSVSLDAHLAKVRAGGEPGAELLNACVAARAMCGWFDKCERGGRFLNDEEANGIFRDGMAFVAAYERLALASLRAGGERWKVHHKMHGFVHLCEDALWLRSNSRFFHCFRDEDFMGLCKRLCQKVHKGPLCEFRILCRYLLRLNSWRPHA